MTALQIYFAGLFAAAGLLFLWAGGLLGRWKSRAALAARRRRRHPRCPAVSFAHDAQCVRPAGHAVSAWHVTAYGSEFQDERRGR